MVNNIIGQLVTIVMGWPFFIFNLTLFLHKTIFLQFYLLGLIPLSISYFGCFPLGF